MSEKLVESINLDNGQKLEIIDISRNIAADTWLVGIIFKIKIKINNDLSDYNNISDKLGDDVIYEVKHERNFIYNKVKDTVFSDVKESFLNTNLKYLSHKNFAEKYIIKKYNEAIKSIY